MTLRTAILLAFLSTSAAAVAACTSTERHHHSGGSDGGSDATGSGAGGAGGASVGSGGSSVDASSSGSMSSSSGSTSSSSGASSSSASSSSTSSSGGVSVKTGDLVITEIMNNPTSAADVDGEWFEVYNATASPIDMAGLVIVSNNDISAPISASVIVPAGGYAVLGVNGDMATNGDVPVDYVYTGIALTNTADMISIQDDLGTIIDFVAYDEASGLDPSGASRSLNPLFYSADQNDSDANFCAATSQYSANSSDFATPGAPNDPCF